MLGFLLVDGGDFSRREPLLRRRFRDLGTKQPADHKLVLFVPPSFNRRANYLSSNRALLSPPARDEHFQHCQCPNTCTTTRMHRPSSAREATTPAVPHRRRRYPDHVHDQPDSALSPRHLHLAHSNSRPDQQQHAVQRQGAICNTCSAGCQSLSLPHRALQRSLHYSAVRAPHATVIPHPQHAVHPFSPFHIANADCIPAAATALCAIPTLDMLPYAHFSTLHIAARLRNTHCIPSTPLSAPDTPTIVRQRGQRDPLSALHRDPKFNMCCGSAAFFSARTQSVKIPRSARLQPSRARMCM
ncbi:hypothetical protein C8F04DRAFT_1368002 [Mycena alexandri]|uniref:Uncharacterized protein n=1 Tax=Mycena alexandri TaxID=1745969 RepID=A0AAD6X0F1_9AGAR|nr:hypothetical protein C8F04DRAFT_1368002 [Mycena alexandri]